MPLSAIPYIESFITNEQKREFQSQLRVPASEMCDSCGKHDVRLNVYGAGLQVTATANAKRPHGKHIKRTVKKEALEVFEILISAQIMNRV